MNQKRKRECSSTSQNPVKKPRIENDSSEKKACNSAENENKMTLRNNPEKDVNLSLSKNILKIPLKTSLKETNSINLSTIEEIHKSAKIKFNEIKHDKNLTYEKILDEVINIYDLDEDINLCFLEKLNQHYKDKKKEIDESTNGQSDDISKLFFKFVFSIKFEKRKKILEDFQYFGENEIFTEKDEKYFYNVSIDVIFRKLIKDLLDLSSTIKSPNTKMTPEIYLEKLDVIFEKYPFPDSSFKNSSVNCISSAAFFLAAFICPGNHCIVAMTFPHSILARAFTWAITLPYSASRLYPPSEILTTLPWQCSSAKSINWRVIHA